MQWIATEYTSVTSRKGRVSRNIEELSELIQAVVTSRKGRVSRNKRIERINIGAASHVPQGACE